MTIEYTFNSNELAECGHSISVHFKDTETLVRRRLYIDNGYGLSITTGCTADPCVEVTLLHNNEPCLVDWRDRIIRVYKPIKAHTAICRLARSFHKVDSAEIEEWWDYWMDRISEMTDEH